ncbi:MAG TPA: penicillin-binding transpeptidase domain-containing protein, partial [Chloroflexota bacterium]|nr:penicillin-binding transpeptidase domain-containing protein [Chloroflexota bacterium]
LAMVGSADYNNKEIKGEVNVALALRQPGSAIKPVTYLTALEKGWNPATIIEDEQTTFPGYPPYTPRNYDGQFHGKVTVRSALANSYNIPAVKALQFVGVPSMLEMSRRLGITSFGPASQYGLALTLGGGEVRLLDLTAAYGVFANHGKYVPPVSILKITDAQGNVLDQWPGAKPQTVVDAGRAYMITSILSDNAARTPAFGPNSPLRLSRPAAVKTGTTDDFKDNWTVGYTGQLVTGVWVGNADNTPMRGTTGLTGAAPIWHDFMEYALKPLPVDPLTPPPGLQKVRVARDSGKLWVEGCPEPPIEEFVLNGQAPTARCEQPTPTPSPTVDPLATFRAEMAAHTPRATSTPLPSVSELRERAATTATAAAAIAAPTVAERRAATSAHLAAVEATIAAQVARRAERTPLPTPSPRPAR